jgi:predicted nucleotidyltransferase
MDKRTVLNIVEQFKNNIAQKGVHIDRVILYGSHANNTQRPDSDIDLVVISDSFKNMDYWQRIDILADAISDIFQPIEAIGMTNKEWNDKTFMAAEYAQYGVQV